MEWWQIIPTIITAIGLLIEVYLRLWPVLKRNATEKKEAKLKMKEKLEAAIKKAEAYRDFGLGELRKIIADSRIPKKLRSQVKELESLASKCVDWRSEAWQVVNTEIRRMSEGKQYINLNESLMNLVHEGLLSTFSGYDGHCSEPIYKAIYEEKLTFELARDSIAEHRWDQSTKIGDKTIMLKDVVQGDQFHKCVEELQQLQKRQCFKMLREVRKAFIENAQAILKELTNVPS